MVTIERPAVGESPRRSGRRGLIAVVAVFVLAVVGIVVWLFAGGDEERTPIEVVQDLAAAMRDDDVDEVNELLGIVPPDFMEQQFSDFLVWSMALEAEPTFSDCTNTAYGFNAQEMVTCTVTYGDNYFYSQVLAESLTSTFEAYVFDDWVGVSDLGTPAGQTPDGVIDVEAEFRSWVMAREDRWELWDQLRLSSQDLQDGAKFFTTRVGRDYASGELRMQLLDEFMASRQ